MEVNEKDSQGSLPVEMEIGSGDVGGLFVTQNIKQENDTMDINDSACEGTFNINFRIRDFNQTNNEWLSPTFHFNNFNWFVKITRQNVKKNRVNCVDFGYFLKCEPTVESSSWSCSVTAKLTLIRQKRYGAHFKREISHVFNREVNDWGFGHFLSWDDVMNPENGFVKDDTVLLEVHMRVDSSQLVGNKLSYVGLMNQGATCYMSSVLQTLFFTNQLRKAVYQMPIENIGSSSKNVVHALQRIFYELQFSDKPVETKKLTRSFGWRNYDLSTQHDVQEFCRVLLDHIEMKMKDTCVEGTIPHLFQGRMTSFIRCKDVDYTSSHVEPFYDIQLKVVGKSNIYESLKEYCDVETLEGENKYDAGALGMHEAEKGIVFTSFPPVVQLHLLRFRYDPNSDTNTKINSRYEFPEKLDLGQFLEGADDILALYTLQAVLVHSGDNRGGHYVVFINPKGDGNWYKFDDNVVVQCTKVEAIDYNFGGSGYESNTNYNTNAYMLVYVRDSAIGDVLQTVSENDIPETLLEQMRKETRKEEMIVKERNEAHLFMHVRVVTEDTFSGHQGSDLFDPQKAICRTIRVLKSNTLRELLQVLSEQFGYPIDAIRPWSMTPRSNQTLRPSELEAHNLDEMCMKVAGNETSWTIFLEMVYPDSGAVSLPDYRHGAEVLLFFKMYDPKMQMLSYCGHRFVPVITKTAELVPILNEKAGLPIDTKLMLYEEIKPNSVERIEDMEAPLAEVIDELSNGDIVVFQRADINMEGYKFPTAREYFRYLFFRIIVTFCNKDIPQDSGFTLELSLKMNCNTMAHMVGERLGTDAYLLQFFKVHCNRPGFPIRYKHYYDGTLNDPVILFPPGEPKKVFYRHISIPINEMEFKRRFKCVWFNSKLQREKDLFLFVNKNGCVDDLFEEAKKQLDISQDRKLRLLEVLGHKIVAVHTWDVRLEWINRGSTLLRLEDIPPEEEVITCDNFFVGVAHFDRKISFNYGEPFLLKLQHGEPFAQVKAKIRQKLQDVPENEFEKYKFAIVRNALPHYVHDDYVIIAQDFLPINQNEASANNCPWLGLDHVNNEHKRANSNENFERAFRIYN